MTDEAIQTTEGLQQAAKDRIMEVGQQLLAAGRGDLVDEIISELAAAKVESRRSTAISADHRGGGWQGRI